jgi:hypothetical protein
MIHQTCHMGQEICQKPIVHPFAADHVTKLCSYLIRSELKSLSKGQTMLAEDSGAIDELPRLSLPSNAIAV